MDSTLYRSSILLIGILAGLYGGRSGAVEIETVSSGDREFRFMIDVGNDPADLFEELHDDSTSRLYTTTLIAMPPGGSVEILSVQPSAPQPLPPGNNSSSTSIEPHQWAHLLRPFEVRGRQLAPLRVYPVANGRVYTQLEVHLRFHGESDGVAISDPVFDKMFKASVANYQQMKQWPTRTKALAKRSALNPLAVSSEWYRIGVDQSGLYRVTGSQLQSAGLSLNGLLPDDIRLFNGGGRQLEVPNELPRPEFREVAVIVDDGGDGSFDRDDYVLFYGESVNRWYYGPNDTVGYHHHHYTTENVYWLTTTGTFGTPASRMSEVGSTPVGNEDTLFTSFYRHVHSERDTIFSTDNSGHQRDYYRWYWTDDENPSFHVAGYNVVPGMPAQVLVVAEMPWSTDSYTLQVSGDAATELSCDDSSCTFSVVSLREGLNEFRLSFSIGGTHVPYLDYVNVSYLSDLTPLNDRLEFDLGSYDGRAHIELTDDFSSPPLILGLDDPRQPWVVDGYSTSNGTLAFAATLNDGDPNHFYAGTLDRTLTPTSIVETTVTDLRAAADQADLIIITPRVFVDAMQEYIDYRRAQGKSVSLVTVEDIIDNFSYGLFDPTAIRDFLKYAYENYPSPAPSLLLMAGDGHWDYLDHLGYDAANYVPPYIHAYDNAYAYSDDNYVYFGEYGALDYDSSYLENVDRGLDMASARWTVQETSEIETITEKTKRYEAASNFGLWRTMVTLVADDEFAAGRTSELIHTAQADTLQMNHLPRLFNRDKVYAIEHPFANTRKPSVNDAIVEAWNSGRLLVNYVGHGNPGLWAHERIFTVVDDVPRLTNYEQLPLVLAASCAIGAFDDPEGQAMAERLLTHTAGGAAAIISATRLVWSSPNKEFNQTAFDVLFGDEALTMCEAAFTAKLLHQLWAGGPTTLTNNDRAFLFIGDPLLKLARPQLGIRYVTSPDSLIALETAGVSGEIVDQFGAVVPLDGLLSIRVYDSDRHRHYNSAENGGTGGTIDYSIDGAAVYRGSAGIDDGHFSFEFIPPLDIRFGGRSARIMTYAVLDTVDAAGLIDSIYVTDSIADVSDSLGPTIVYEVVGRENFASGDLINLGDLLRITLSDQSGINLAGGLGHGVTLEVDGSSDRMINLTDGFEYDTDGFTTGSVQYTVDSLDAGRHSFKIKAWDNANNSATAEFSAEVTAAGGPVVTDLLNYPNPMQETTRFSFYAVRSLESFSLEIFTLSGRKIKSYSQSSLPPGYHDGIVWSGEDFAGDRVATGVYIYKATARAESGSEQVEILGKVVVIN